MQPLLILSPRTSFQPLKRRWTPYGPWGHFPKRMFGTKPCSVDSDSSASDSYSDSDSNSNSDSHSSSNSNSNTVSDSGSGLTSCSPDPLSSEPDYSPDEE